MKIVYEKPPNYEAIAKAFDIRNNKTVVFTYGDTLYVPTGRTVNVDKALIRHEETHVRQQNGMPEYWWKRYLTDPQFRFDQELEAYREQYRDIVKMPFKVKLGYLNHIAKSLAGEMYGNLVTVEEARNMITKGIKR